MEEIGQFAEKEFHELLRGHGRAIGMPEGRHHHVLDGALFAVGEADFEFLAEWGGAGVGAGVGLMGAMGGMGLMGGEGLTGSPSHSGSAKW